MNQGLVMGLMKSNRHRVSWDPGLLRRTPARPPASYATDRPVRPSVCPSLCTFFCLSICLYFCMSVFLFFVLYVRRPTSACSFVRPSAYQSYHLSYLLSVRLYYIPSVRLSVLPSVRRPSV